MHAIARSFVVAAVVATATHALAQDKVEPAVVGEWRAPLPMGLTLTLKVSADGKCDFDEELGPCTAKNGALVFSSPEAGRITYRYKVSGASMTLSGGDLDGPMTFKRKGGAAPQPERVATSDGAAAQPAPSTAQAPVPPPAAQQEEVKPSGPGATIEKEAWGVKFTAPAGWKFFERDGVYAGGHDTEAGLMLIRFYRSATTEQIHGEFAKGFQDPQLKAFPAGPLVAWKKGSASGLAGEMNARLQNGESARVRIVIAQSDFGGALAVMGLTTEAQYPRLKARVEQLASTVTFKKPKTVKNAALAGSYWFYAGSSSGGTYSREAKLTLCSDGRFSRGGEMYGSGGSGTAFTARSNAGTWAAQGDGNTGTLILTYGNGEVAEIPYAVSTNPKDRSGYGPAVRFGRDLYQKTGGGNCD